MNSVPRLACHAILWVALLHSSPAVFAAISDAEFQRLFDDLDAKTYPAREAAANDLVRQARLGNLSPDQMKILQRAAAEAKGPDGSGLPLEVNQRARLVLGRILQGLPAYAKIYSLVQIKEQGYLNPADVLSTAPFRFDSAAGRFRERTYPDLLRLEEKWQAVRNAVDDGNPDALDKALKEFKDYVDALPTGIIESLQLRDDATGARINRPGMAALIQQARDCIPDFRNQLFNLGAAANPGAAAPLQIPAGRPVQLAGIPDPSGAVHGFGLDITDVTSPGNLLLLYPSDLNSLRAAPPGFQFVALPLELAATGGLDVNGLVRVSIEYGDFQLMGNPVLDPGNLEFVRLANGEAQFLPAFNDLGASVLSASYTPSADPSADDFGLFAVVQRAPETGSTAGLLLAAAGLLAWVALRQRTAGISRR